MSNYDFLIREFKKNGGRITVQRRNLIKLILDNPSSTCKELYYLAREKDASVSRATVYRIVHNLEEMGYVQKKSVELVLK